MLESLVRGSGIFVEKIRQIKLREGYICLAFLWIGPGRIGQIRLECILFLQNAAFNIDLTFLLKKG